MTAMLKMNYQEGLKKHLAQYKIDDLGIWEDGLYKKNKKPYPHILPEDDYKLNILETIREQFWDYFESDESGLSQRRHVDFHHLNSSQAMCFNLFFPFVMDNNRYLPILLETLELPIENVSEVSFEKILDKKEGTNFDFYIKYKNGMQILFEIKLSENVFGSGKADKSHQLKFIDIYKDLITNVVSKKYQVPSYFLKEYQLIRNFSYLGRSNQNFIFFLYPLMNTSLDNSVDKLFPDILEGRFSDRVNVGYLENIITALQSHCDDKEHSLLIKHFDEFIKKYIILYRSKIGFKNLKYVRNMYFKIKKNRNR